ncbi:pirin family protein, partial [Aliarcobacter butzleri]
RQVYFVQIEGKAEVNGTILENGDAMEIVDEEILNINPLIKSHILFIEMQKK